MTVLLYCADSKNTFNLWLKQVLVICSDREYNNIILYLCVSSDTTFASVAHTQQTPHAVEVFKCYILFFVTNIFLRSR